MQTVLLCLEINIDLSKVDRRCIECVDASIMSSLLFTVFLGQIDSELVQYISCVALQCSEETAISIHNNEAKFIVIGKQS